MESVFGNGNSWCMGSRFQAGIGMDAVPMAVESRCKGSGKGCFFLRRTLRTFCADPPQTYRHKAAIGVVIRDMACVRLSFVLAHELATLCCDLKPRRRRTGGRNPKSPTHLRMRLENLGGPDESC